MEVIFVMFMVVFFGFFLLLCLIPAVIQIIGMWKLFVKAGRGGWESLIPFYNIVVLFQISKITPLWTLLYLIPILILPFSVFDSLMYPDTVTMFSLMVSLFTFISSIVLYALNIYQAYMMSKAFTKTSDSAIGYTIGLIFLPWLFYLLMALDKKLVYVDFREEENNETTSSVILTENVSTSENIVCDESSEELSKPTLEITDDLTIEPESKELSNTSDDNK